MFSLFRTIHLFRFTRQSKVWCYTSADVAVTYNGETYSPLNISRSSIRETTESTKNQVTITLPTSAGVVDNWRTTSPTDTIFVTCFAMQRGSNTASAEWTGRVVQPKMDDVQTELVCDPSNAPARMKGLQLQWMRGCPLVQYGQGDGMCNLSKADNGIETTVEYTENNRLIASDDFADADLLGGFVEWTANGLTEYRTVIAQEGKRILFDMVFDSDSLEAGDTVTAYPGCGHNYAGCAALGNDANYGGVVTLPVKNPFRGDLVW